MNTTPQPSEREMVAISYKHNAQEMADAIVNLRRDLGRCRNALATRDHECADLTQRAEGAELRANLAYEREAQYRAEIEKRRTEHEKDFNTLVLVLDERDRLRAEITRRQRWASTGRW